MGKANAICHIFRRDDCQQLRYCLEHIATEHDIIVLEMAARHLLTSLTITKQTPKIYLLVTTATVNACHTNATVIDMAAYTKLLEYYYPIIVW